MPEDCIKLQRDTGPPLCSAFLLTPHLCIQTLRVVTLLHSSIIHNTAVSHLSGFFIIIIFFLFCCCCCSDSQSYPNFILHLPWTNSSCEHNKTVLDRCETCRNRSVFGLELSLRSFSMLCYPNCVKS